MKDPGTSPVAKRHAEVVSAVKWLVPVVLFSAWPFIHFANQNKHESFDTLRLVADATVYVATMSCLVVVAGMIAPRRRFGAIASVAAMGTFVLFTYGAIETVILGFGEGRPRYSLMAWCILAIPGTASDMAAIALQCGLARANSCRCRYCSIPDD